MKTEGVISRMKGHHQETGRRMWFECAVCGIREPFENFSILSAQDYNERRKREGTMTEPGAKAK